MKVIRDLRYEVCDALIRSGGVATKRELMIALKQPFAPQFWREIEVALNRLRADALVIKVGDKGGARYAITSEYHEMKMMAIHEFDENVSIEFAVVPEIPYGHVLAPEALEGMVGQVVPMKRDGKVIGTARVIKSEGGKLICSFEPVSFNG